MAKQTKTFTLMRICARGQTELGIKRGESAEAIFAAMSKRSKMSIFSRKGNETVAETAKGHAHFYLMELD